MGRVISDFLFNYFKKVIDISGVMSSFATVSINPTVPLKDNLYLTKIRYFFYAELLILPIILFTTYFFTTEAVFLTVIKTFSVFILACSIIYLVLFQNFSLDENSTDIVPIDAFLLFGAIGIFSFYYIALWLFFSKIVPFDSKRKEEMHQLVNSSVIKNDFYYISYRENLAQIESFKNQIKEELEKGAKIFFSKHFTYSQSVFRSWIEKVYINGRVNENFLYHSLMIPRAKEMPAESLKIVFVALAQKEYHEFHFKSWAELQKISSKFKKMTISNLVQLFTRPFELQDFYTAILNDIDAEDSMNHFFLFNSKKIKNQALESISDDRFIIKLLKSKMDYWVASKDFKNCLNEYFFDYQDDVLIFYKDQKPFACVNVDVYGKIGEISGYENRFVEYDDQSLIKRIILDCLNKEIKNEKI